MPASEKLKEAQRVMRICNACRYCEGYCAVYPAMELRRTFTDQDLKYLANLCHNCRACYYACQYAPPHEFDVNVPRAFGELRLECYREFARPSLLAGMFRRNGLTVGILTAASLLTTLLLLGFFQDPAVIFAAHKGANAFYRVIPYPLFILPFSALVIFMIAVLFWSNISFWRKTGGKLFELLHPRANLQAIADALRLKYLDGGGHGCNYPDDRFSMRRRYFHHLVFYGFMLCLASTTVAATYHHFLHRPAPYPFFSWPVVLGTVGGLALLVGTAGLLVLKTKMDPLPGATRAIGMDVGFLVLLFLTSLTGILLLALRETSAMGLLLAVHLGFVAALFVSMPYGKFVHAIYRFLSLVRNAREQSQ
jgi:citrate/tricarballylate utilization protein